ncbi:MAG TPA: hypothetical protein VEV45_20935 [Streptosporangiaceae bacterium]|nr:hypothetical protein [Streptosporangiaceae bacterium]
MDNQRMVGAADRLAVGVSAPHGDFAGVHTDFKVERWDAEQTDWVAGKVRASGRFRPGIDLVPSIFRLFKVAPYSVTIDYDCNLIVQNGWVALLGGVAGTTMSPKFGAANGRIGVGTSVTAAAYAQTTLVGDTGAASTTSYFKLVSGAPTIATGSTPPTLTFSAVFGTSVANFAWQEFGTDAGTADSVSNATTGGTFFNRGVSSQGTKASGQTWTATETISFGYPSGSGTVS